LHGTWDANEQRELRVRGGTRAGDSPAPLEFGIAVEGRGVRLGLFDHQIDQCGDRDGPTKPRGIYVPDLPIDTIKLKARNFR
jgi:hypothetical protein